MGSNTASYFLGGPEQSAATPFYLVGYFSKHCAALGNVLPLVFSAVEHVRNYKSQADNPDSPERLGIQFAERLCNSLSSTEEYSFTQASIALLGAPANFTTTAYTNIYAWAAIAKVNESSRIQAKDPNPEKAWTDQETA